MGASLSDSKRKSNSVESFGCSDSTKTTTTTYELGTPRSYYVMERSDFDRNSVFDRLDKMWSLDAILGEEKNPFEVYLNEFVGNRFVLINGLQLLRDDLQLSFDERLQDSNFLSTHHTDLTKPSVLSTLAFTDCGDRVDKRASAIYETMVASRFCCVTELGEFKPEAFLPTGGGIDDGFTLATVTADRLIDKFLRKKLYDGNSKSFVLCNIDLRTHCGKLLCPRAITDGYDQFKNIPCYFGKCQESIWSEQSDSCCAIVDCLRHFDAGNAVHRRLRRDIGEENFEYLSKNQILTQGEVIPIRYLIASAIVAVRGMVNTASALAVKELDGRGVGSLTASIIINSAGALRVGTPDNIIYLARCTVFNKEVRVQGFGTDARLYSGEMKNGKIVLYYDGMSGKNFTQQIMIFDS